MVSIPSYNTHIATYDPIATITLTSAQSSVTFSNIPTDWTDLAWVANVGQTSSQILGIRFNNDTGNNFSSTRMSGNGSSMVSARASNESYIRGFNWGIGEVNTLTMISIGSIFSYSNTNVYKTTLDSFGRAAGGVGRIVGLWRSTSAINRIDFLALSSDTFIAGSKFSLYGIRGEL